MIRKNLKKLLLIFFISFLFFEISFGVSGAGVRPLRTNLEISPGETKSFGLTIINNENYNQVMEAEFQTYVSHDENGYPVAENIEEDDFRNISSWISFEEKRISLGPNEEKNVKVSVSVPENAVPGGKYGALIYGPVLAESSGVSFRARVASLLLVQVSGEEIYDGEVNYFKIKEEKIYSDQGVVFDINFKNEGNIHVSPKGSVALLKEGNKILNIFSFLDKDGKKLTLDEIPVNRNLNFVLPKIERSFNPSWTENINEGEFEATLNFIFKKGGEFIKEEEKIVFEIDDSLETESFEIKEEEEKTIFVLSIKNNGNIYQKISGNIDVLNEFDFKVAEVLIPENIEYIKPEETKEFRLDFLDSKLPDGKYSVNSNVTYGLTDKILEIESSFGFSGPSYLLIFSIILLIIILVFIVYIWKERKKNKIKKDLLRKDILKK